MKAIKISTENIISVIEIEEPAWKGMGKEVGGSFEHVNPRGFQLIDTTLCMIVNEEGRLLGLPDNKVGCMLYNHKVNFYEPIVGNILIMADGYVNGEPDIVGLDDIRIKRLLIEFQGIFGFLTERKCRVCGCTHYNACEGGCYWSEVDLCSECVGKEVE